MARTKQDLNKTSQTRFKKFEKQVKDYPYIEDKEKFCQIYRDVLTNEVRSQKTCSEKSVTDIFMKNIIEMLNSSNQIDEDFFDKLKIKSRKQLAAKYTNKTFDNNIDIYFNDVKREYILCPQSESTDLEFLPENRDIFIKNNLKLVINCAKRYQNLGLPFEDLIQIGNLGLLVAFDKFDKDRANLRIKINNIIDESKKEKFALEDAKKVINKGFTYSKNIEATMDGLPEEGFESKEAFHKWVNTNVKTAVFSSVAFKWIRAYIINELTKLGSVIRVPKTANMKIDELTGEPVKQSITIINLDSLNPYTDDNYHDNELSEVTQEEFIIEDERISNNEKNEALQDIVETALFKLDILDRRILKKRYGIGLPYQLSVNEIAESENISANKVKYSLQTSMKKILESFSDNDIEMISDLLN